MGLLYGGAKILRDLSAEHRFYGKLLTLGKQNVLVTPEQWKELCPGDTPPTEHHSRWDADFVESTHFFKSLGFDKVEALDVSRYENVKWQWNLNTRAVPSILRARFDMIFDGSTIEHIFHLPNVLANIHQMLRVGGRVVHMSPSNNFMDDGFYQLSPTFFRDYYRENEYKIDSCSLHFMSVHVNRESEHFAIETTDRLVEYDPDELAKVSASFMPYGGELCETVVIARKTDTSTSGKMPFQSRYADKEYWRAGL